MVGNDLVDLQKAKLESNWQRKGYLDKIYTFKEQQFIFGAACPELMVWLLWTMKESAYKVVNRLTGIRRYSPLSFSCTDLKTEGMQTKGKVFYQERELSPLQVRSSLQQFRFFTQTESTSRFIHSTAVLMEDDFDTLHTYHLNASAPYLERFNTHPDHINQYLSQFSPYWTNHLKSSAPPYRLSKDKAGIPEMIHTETGKKYAASVSHHGRFLAIVYSDSLLSAG